MIKISQMQVIPGNPEKNLAKIVEDIKEAQRQKVSLIIFPEMAVPGYLLGDEWENESFVRECDAMNSEIVEATRWGISAIWGNVLVDNSRVNEDGRLRKYNAAFVASNWERVSNGIFDWHTIKSLMPKYREFDDERHFYSLIKYAQENFSKPEEFLEPFELVIDWVKRKVGLIICEDMWDEDYILKPTDILKSKWADLIVNLSASPFGIGKQAKRDSILAEKSKWIDYIYANNVGVQNNWKTVFSFDGASVIYKDGAKVAQAKGFNEVWLDSESGINNWEAEIEKVFNSLIYSIREFLASINQKKVVIGLSGWIDSAVVAVLLVLAIGRENVVAVNMPSRFNTNTTKNIAKDLAERLGIEYIVAPIQESVDYTKWQIEEVIWKPIADLVYENIQARDRWSRLLAGIAASLGAVFTNNGNKTEIALGYATLYWDVNGSVCPIWDLYKSQVYELARYINANYDNIIPEEAINVMPSAELNDNQNVEEGKWDPFNYEYTDKILYQFIEARKDPEFILEKFQSSELEWILWLKWAIIWDYFENIVQFISDLERLYKGFKLNFFKRVQAPPILAVSKRAFGFDLREAQNWVYFTRKYREFKEQLLQNK